VPAAFSDLVIHGVYGEYVWGIDRDEYGVESVIRARLVKSDSQGGLPN